MAGQKPPHNILPSYRALADKESTRLTLKHPIRKKISRRFAHLYSINPGGNQYASILIHSRGGALGITLYKPNGRIKARYPCPDIGKARISFIAQNEGSYLLEIYSLAHNESDTGNYELQLDEIRPATDRDLVNTEWHGVFAEAERIRSKMTIESSFIALDKFKQVLSHWRRSEEEREEAITLYAIASTYRLMGENLKANKFYTDAYSIAEQCDFPELQLDVLTSMAYHSAQSGDHLRAGVISNRAFQQLGKADDDYARGETISNMGDISYAAGERLKALDYYYRSLHHWCEVDDYTGQAGAFRSIGNIFSELSNSQAAFFYYARSLNLWHRLNNKKGLSQTLIDIGHLFTKLGDMQTALDYYDRASPLIQPVGNHYAQAAMLQGQAYVYNTFKDHEMALECYKKALRIWKKIGYYQDEAGALIVIGEIQHILRNHQDALKYYNEALSLIRTKTDLKLEPYIYQNIGLVYQAMSDRNQSLSNFDIALSGYRASSNRRGEAELLNNIGDLYFENGEIQLSTRKYQEALALNRSVGAVFEESKTLFNMAKVGQQVKQYDKAISNIEEAIKLVEVLRKKVTSYQLRMSYFASIQQYYDFYMDLLVNLGDQPSSDQYRIKAFEISERARARNMLEILNDVGKDRIGAGNPEKTALIEPNPLNIREIREQVLEDDNTMLLEYRLGEKRSYLWGITQDSVTFSLLPGRSTIEPKAEALIKLLQEEDKIDSDFWRMAGDLSGTLLGPIENQLKAKRLLFVVEGTLQYLPFGALPYPQHDSPSAQPSDGLNSVKPRLLIDDHEVVSMPSASALAVLRRQIKSRTQASKHIAVVADPVFNDHDIRIISTDRKHAENPAQMQELSRMLGDTNDADTNREIPRLQSTIYEAEEILKLIPTEDGLKMMGFDANRANVMGSKLSDYRIVHFATHGLINSAHPEFSCMVLSMFDDRGQSQNGFLRLSDIYNMNLSADLVVLSACRTALGKDIKGEGVIGLTRGFMYAGAARVISSLWKVRDQATAEFMSLFYKKMLHRNLSASAALRETQLEFRKHKRWNSPYYWAAFTIQGEWN